jgi:molybdopterin-guanine dinucleotide biosynthesis protein A
MILFLPVNSPIISPDLIDYSQARAILEEKLTHNNSTAEEEVHDLHSLDQKMNHFDLETMKHNAIVHFWFSEIGLEEF